MKADEKYITTLTEIGAVLNDDSISAGDKLVAVDRIIAQHMKHRCRMDKDGHNRMDSGGENRAGLTSAMFSGKR